MEKVAPLLATAPLPGVRCLVGRRAGPPEDLGGIPCYEGLLEALAEKAASQRKRMPSQFAGFDQNDPNSAELASADEFLSQLPAIVVS